MEDDIIRRLQIACDSFRTSDIEINREALREKLTDREWEITQMLIECGNAEIAAALHITEQTVRDSVEDIYRKLKIRERCRAAETVEGIL